MKLSFSAIAIAASVAFVNAQTPDLSGIPTCALACFATAVPAAGCELTDTKCQCTTGKAKITESITACVSNKCSAEDIAKLAPAVAAICASAGVTVTDLPTGVTASGSSPTNTASVTSSATGASQSTGAASANGVSFGLAAGLVGVAAWL